MNEDPRQDERRFGDYEVLRDARGEPWLLGSGSYGQTYKARNRLLGTELAIKVIRRDLSSSESVRQRFLNEGRSLANLAHEHIALLRHFGISGDGQIYYAMDYCAGGTLAERVLRHGPRPPGEALEIIRQTAAALAAAHAQGIIHRDLKPGNVMLAHAPPPLHVKVIDFGLAQASVAGAAGGRFHGTAQWASPEQLRERPLDGRSDLFALGLILWFLLGGHAPDAGSTTEVVQLRLAPAGYADRLPPGFPPDLRGLLENLLETDPDRRVASAAVLLGMLDRLAADYPYDPQTESREPPALTATDDLPCLPAEATMDERYARLTRLHRDLAGEWFEAELEAGRGSRIVFVLDEQRARSPALRAIVRANLVRLWQHPVDGMPRFAVLLESGDALMAEWEGVGGGDFASWLKLRRKPGLRELIAFLAGVARVADETVERGVPGVGLMAFQVRLEADLSGEGGGLGGAAPRLFPLLLDAADLPPGMIETADASGSTLVLVGPELACDRIHMMARLIYRAVARHEVADAVAFAPEAYIQVSGLSESGNQLLCQALCHRGQWDSCLSLIRSLAAQESLSLTGSGSGKGSGLPAGSSSGNRDVVRNAAAGPPAAVRQASSAPPVATVGPTPPAPRLPSMPPTGSRLVDHLRQRVPLGLWLVLGASILATVVGITLMCTMGGNGTQPVQQPSVPSVPSVPSDPSVPSAMGPEAALARGGAYENFRGMRFVEAGTKRVMFCVWETRVGDFKAFVDDTRHDAEHKNEFGNLSSTVEPTADGPAWTQAGGSWKTPHFPPGYEQDETHPVVCVSGFDAERFCVWLTKRDKNLTAGWRYRLPTDREWSAACPDKSRKDAWPPPLNGGNYCGKEAMIGAFKGYDNDLALANWSDDWPRTAPVGSFQPNSHDLYDMRGNVAEWCATSYDPSMNPGETPDPGEDADGGNLRVLRGASWCDSRGAKMRADYRDRENPLVRNDFSGFRVVLADGEPAATKSSF